MKTTTMVLNISVTVTPIHNYRTTKGGKRIMIGAPGFSLNTKISITPVDTLRNGDYVWVGGIMCVYRNIEKDTWLVNTSMNQFGQLDIETGKEIQIGFRGRVVGEGTTTLQLTKSKSV